MSFNSPLSGAGEGMERLTISRSSSTGDRDDPPELRFQEFFADVIVPEESERSGAIERIKTALLASAKCPEKVDENTIIDRFIEDEDLSPEQLALVRRHGRKLVDAHIASVVRLARDTPCADILSRFSSLLRELIERGVELPPSASIQGPSQFVPESVVAPLLPEKASTRELFEEVFFTTGRFSHLDRMIGWHPTFLREMTIMNSFLMNEDGPLPHEWRPYIAIMAASQYQCEYLIDLQGKEFKMRNGDPAWLNGLNFAPPKVQRLAELNALLAHQPWKITKDHISGLVKRAENTEQNWTMSELVHAMVIMVTFHALSGLVFGLGVTPELDYDLELDPSRTTAAPTHEEQKSNDGNVMEVDLLLERIRAAPTSSAGVLTTMDAFEQAGTKEDTKLDEAPVRKGRRSQLYTGGVDIGYKDFDVRSKDYTVFRSHDYNWKEHGVALVQRFYNGAGIRLDSELTHMYELTYNTVKNRENVETGRFRRAIWYYAHRLYGVCYDDYDYQDVNRMLNKGLKIFVKKVACLPASMNAQDFRDCGVDLGPDEKGHVALLAMEGHKQSALLYGLHAVMKFMA